MTVRKRKRKNRCRGHRTHGQGDTKNNRGSGSRGGVGRAGSHKHKFSKYYLTFNGKKAMKPKTASGKALQLWRIEKLIPEMLKNGSAKKEGDKIIVDCKKIGVSKIIGPGKIEGKIVFENAKLSKKLAGSYSVSGAEE